MEYYQLNELQNYLNPGERLHWTGKPKTGIVFQPSDFFIIPFGIFWTVFSVFWVAMASQASFFFAMFGMPFVLVGLFLLFGRFIADSKTRAKTVYGITDTRIIIKSGLFSQTVKSIDIKTLTNVEFEEKADGSGTITLGMGIMQPFANLTPRTNFFSGNKGVPALEFIPEVRKVYNKIIELQRK